MPKLAPLACALLALGTTARIATPVRPDCEVPVPRDSTDIIVSLLLRTAAPEVAEIANSYRFPRKDLAMIADGMRMYLAAPRSVSLAVTRNTPLAASGKGDTLAVPDVTSGVAFVVSRDGSVRQFRPHRSSPVPQLDSMLAAAVEQASASGDFGAVLVETRADTLALWAELAQDDSSARVFGVPLFRLRVPRFAVTPVRPLPGGPSPNFPGAAARVGATDVVELQYVVGADGKGDPSRARVLRGRYREFIDEALQALPAMRYSPAVVKGCPQAMWSHQAFQFQAR